MSFLSALEEIVTHFNDVDSAIKQYFAQILNGDFHNRPDLVDCQVHEIRNLLQSRLLENERAISLILLAALESWFRVDCKARAEKPGESSRFKDMYASSNQLIARIRFNDILEAWSGRDNPTKQLVGDIRGSLKYRHWLAHGRYWPPNWGREYSFASLYSIAKNAAAMLDTT